MAMSNEKIYNRLNQENLELRQANADIARERDAALRRVAQMSDHPPVCPVSGQRYFMTIEHPTRGMVATYGGPLDSYTIPEANEEGELFRERYDHDRGCWYDTECLDVWLVAGSDLAEKDERNTKLLAANADLARERDEANIAAKEWMDAWGEEDKRNRQLAARLQETEGGLRLCIGMYTDTPWMDVRQEDVEGYIRRWTELAALREGAGGDGERGEE